MGLPATCSVTEFYYSDSSSVVVSFRFLGFLTISLDYFSQIVLLKPSEGSMSHLRKNCLPL